MYVFQLICEFNSGFYIVFGWKFFGVSKFDLVFSYFIIFKELNYYTAYINYNNK